MDNNRKTAYEALFDIEKNGAYSNLSINRLIQKNQPDNPAFVRELVYGTLRYKLQLDFYIKLISEKKHKIKKPELVLLRMGIYQLLYMNSVPEYAAVNETVLLAKKYARGREGYVNGMLRGILKKRDTLCLPNKEEGIVNYLSIQYSILPWIVSLWLSSYGRQQTEALLAASNQTPELSIRVNLLKNTKQELKEELERLGFLVKESSLSSRALLVSGSRLLETLAYVEGRFSVQDESSIFASDILNAKAGETVIDVCAAPGGKAFATAELMENQGQLIAMDLYEHKLALINETKIRNDIQIIKTKCHDSTQKIVEFYNCADKVLADVPCSGLGVLRRKPEIKYKEIQDLTELIETQKKILHAASLYVKKGGILLYSTCTINKSENEHQVEDFLACHKDFVMIEQKQLLPTQGVDGFYICKMRREN